MTVPTFGKADVSNIFFKCRYNAGVEVCCVQSYVYWRCIVKWWTGLLGTLATVLYKISWLNITEHFIQFYSTNKLFAGEYILLKEYNNVHTDCSWYPGIWILWIVYFNTWEVYPWSSCLWGEDVVNNRLESEIILLGIASISVRRTSCNCTVMSEKLFNSCVTDAEVFLRGFIGEALFGHYTGGIFIWSATI